MTPEGRVKFQVKSVLLGRRVYYHMPVQNGMGAPTLDFTGCHKGFYYAVETKAPGKDATPRQRNTMIKMIASGASIFLIDSDGCDDMLALLVWLDDPKPAVVGPAVHRTLQLEAAATVIEAFETLREDQV